MKKLFKSRWRMWRQLNSRGVKFNHGVLVFLGVINLTFSIINPSITGWATTLIWFMFTLSCIMWNTWRAAYVETESIRAFGAATTAALHEHTFIHITNADGTYYITPEHIGEHPDDLNGEVFTEEIVIRRGIDSDGTDITAYRIPDDLDEVVAVGMLETTKQQYLHDTMEKDT